MESIGPGLMKRRYHRKQPIKFMTIEMHEPFHWPEVPEEIRVADARAARKRTGEAEPENEAEPEIVFNTQLFREEREAREKRQDPEASGRRVPWFEGSDNILHRPDHSEGGKQSEAVREPTVKEFRDAYAAEAEKLLAGRAKWSPTWKTMQDFMPLTPRDGGRIRDEK
jgi:hypothetical protein